ncbi:MAG: hypothetical protein JXQ30_01565 [Spirochaetes bacterium]|nr:hypothetical protein [Spirochaetota bacterium]
MSGEAIRSIRQSEEEAAKMIDDAKAETKRVIEAAEKKKKGLFTEKDELLSGEEEKIKKRYAEESKTLSESLERGEIEHIGKVDERCKRNLKKVAEYIADQITME